MKKQAKKKSYKKIALILSLSAMILWAFLGTGASLAWFSDSSPEINNIFHFTDFKLKVSHLDENKEWAEIRGDTEIFDKNALYEPGYVQVVYLKVENKGALPLQFSTAVNVNGCIVATNVFGQEFMLQDYLRFGAIHELSEKDILDGVIDREFAKEKTDRTVEEIADMPLHKYDTESATLHAGKTAFIALVIYMPEDVGNVANYRGNTIPKVELGITVKAEQIKS